MVTLYDILKMKSSERMIFDYIRIPNVQRDENILIFQFQEGTISKEGRIF